ncbi:MAG: SMP-30/gluconolactonase/LRE family protein [Bacteroides sp.]
MKAILLHRCSDQTGEAATWLSGPELFLWVDIDGGILHTYDPKDGTVTEHLFSELISSIIPRKGNDAEVILALKNRLISYHLTDQTFTTLLEIDGLRPFLRTNDCKASPEGRIWLGVMHMNDHRQTGTLYRVDSDLSLNRVLEHQSIPNGLVWNKEGDKMYYADSGRGCIEEYAYDRTTGSIRLIRTAIQVPPEYGVPDGMTIDADGLLWVAHWGGFGVYIWNPENGQLVNKIEVPVPNVASCTFGGTERRLLFITTARSGLTDAEKEIYPLSGSLFVAEVPDVIPGENHYPFCNRIKNDVI